MNNSLNSVSDIFYEDQNDIFNSLRDSWKSLKGEKIFLTGSTGFFGKWLLESLAQANNILDLNVSAVVLTRNLNEVLFKELINNPSIEFYKGDIRDFKFPTGDFKYIIHGATTSAFETYYNQDPLIKHDIITNGTRRVLEFAKLTNCNNFLYLSSASAYGRQLMNKSKLSEELNTAPLTNDKNFDFSVLGESKRIAELFTTIYSQKHNINTSIARCFSFVGPFIPINIHYAIGNFIRDALIKKNITINGSGNSYRSYMYMTDLTIWLWTILFQGANCEIYNVGSDEEINIKDLANRIKKILNTNINIIVNHDPNSIDTRYIPDISKIKKNLKLNISINLNKSITRTIDHIKQNRSFYNFD